MGLKVNISGSRFRASDKRLKVADQLRILQQRLSNPAAIRIRAGDNPSRLAEILAMRQPIDLKVEGIKMPAIDTSQIKILEMVQIPTGKFKMGSTEYKVEGPVRDVEISAFAIGKYEVTNEEYRAYLEATDQEVPELVADPAKARHPVVNVSWHDAVAYCKWLSENTGRKFRLPTEAEREYAARSTDGRKYPWGNEWKAQRATFHTDGTRAVDAYPEGASPFGVMDLSGNICEWTADWYDNRYDAEDLKDPKGPEKGSAKVLHGGSWFDGYPDDLRSAGRLIHHPEVRGSAFGFRVAEDK